MGALLDAIDLAAAATVDALRGALPAFEPRVHRLRPLAGQQRSAANIAACAAGLRARRRPGVGRGSRTPTRCAAPPRSTAPPARLSASSPSWCPPTCNAVTDNPLVFEDPPEVISAGNFHGQSLALAFDTLRLGLADLGSISERRTFRLLSPTLNGGRLPAFLTADAGTSSGYMVIQYTAAALVAELRALAHPVSVDIDPHLRQPGGPRLDGDDRRADGAARRSSGCERVVAIELLCACQALDCDPGEPGPAVAAVHAAVRERVAPLSPTGRRPMTLTRSCR